MNKAVISAVEQKVKDIMAGHDAAHDWLHIARVRATAMAIAEKTPEADAFIVELGALLHDIADYKFSDGDEKAGGRASRKILDELGVDQETIDHVANIVDNVSFKGGSHQREFNSVELDVVQDADRIDALGAIGIARCMAYSGANGRAIYDPDMPPRMNMTKEEYINNKGTAVNHFHEKLLLLKDRINTEGGRKIAQQRHQFLLEYLQQLQDEIDGKA